jgi:hypothetical protein
MPYELAMRHPHQLLPDAFPFQVLGPDHLARAPEDLRWEPLPNGRGAISIGTIDEWSGSREQARAARLRAREALRGIVGDSQFARRLVKETQPPHPREDF